MNISEAAKNRAFGPTVGRKPAGPLHAPLYHNPAERGNYWQSKGRQRPALKYNKGEKNGSARNGPPPNRQGMGAPPGYRNPARGV